MKRIKTKTKYKINEIKCWETKLKKINKPRKRFKKIAIKRMSIFDIKIKWNKIKKDEIERNNMCLIFKLVFVFILLSFN
jgi:hypothetical protein